MVLIKSESIQISGHRLMVQHLSPLSGGREVVGKPTLVFLHDAIGSIGQWRGFPQKLVDVTGCKGFVYDRPGYGGSDPQPNKRTPDYLHDEALKVLPEVLRVSKLDDIILIGHSDGGSIALIFAGNVPPDIRLRGIVTEAAHVFVEGITLQGIRTAVEVADTTDFKKKLSKFHGEKTETIFAGWHEIWLGSNFRNWNIEGYLPSIHCPSLILQGEKDEYGTKAQVEVITSAVKGPTQSLLIPHCGHVPHYQAEEVVLDAIKEFILKIK